MAYVANIVTVTEMQFMAGAGVDAAGDVDDNHIALQKQAQGYLSSLLKYKLDAVGFTAIDGTLSEIITEWAARYGGMGLILFNTNAYSDRIEAEDMVNVHLFRMRAIEKELNKADVQDFLGI